MSISGFERGISRREFVISSLSALAAPTVLGCWATTEPEPEPDPSGARLTARPGSPTVTPTIGLSDLAIDGGPSGILYVPDSYAPDTPTALFVGLHGAGGSSADWQSYHARAEARGMIFLATDSSASTWDLLRFDRFGADVDALDRALQYTFDRCRIDPTRIALGGFSDGASYALSLGVSNGDVLSHLVGYSPGFLRLSSSTVGNPRIYVSHGQSDPILPVTASRDSIVPRLREAGYDVTYEEFDGGHEVPAAISESALDWFLG
jgi:predicted esterase